jgi:hypothetical protein
LLRQRLSAIAFHDLVAASDTSPSASEGTLGHKPERQRGDTESPRWRFGLVSLVRKLSVNRYHRYDRNREQGKEKRKSAKPASQKGRPMAKESYVGRAGQLAAMAEFLLCGYNVAIPEVDEGDDIFVVNDAIDRLWRVQVKTAIGVSRHYGFSGQFLISLGQLQEIGNTPLFYVFCLRAADHWKFVPISQIDLGQEYERHGVGSVAGDNLLLYLAFRPTALICSGRDWQIYRNNWNPWPALPS